MEENKKHRQLTRSTDLVTCLLSRPMFYALNTFGKRSISDIKVKHLELGFKKTLLSENEIDKGYLYMIYQSNGYFYESYKKPTIDWGFFHDSVLKSKHFVEEIRLTEDDHAFKVKFMEEFMDDFNYIIEGNYSKVSNEYISRFYPDDKSLMYHLKNKTPDIKEAYSLKFKVKESLFDDCANIGPIIDKQKETLILSSGIIA
jgi:hypothetical protein